MSDHEKSAELEGKEAERAALAHIRKEQELRTGASFDHWLLKYLEEGDSPHFREQLRTVTKDYLFEVTRHPHIIKAAVPEWVTRLLVVPMPPVLDMTVINQDQIDRLNEHFREYEEFRKKRTEGKSTFMAYFDPDVPVYSSELDELANKKFNPLPKDKPESEDAE